MSKKSERKSLEEIYKEAREREGPVKIPPQVDKEFLASLEKIAKVEKFDELIKEFKVYQDRAQKNPGKIIEGNMILGAPAPEYYEPSEEEKRLAEIGRKIGMVLNSVNKKNVKKLLDLMFKNKIFVDQIIYQDIQFFHVDVVGSGRFIYPHITWDIAHSILDVIMNAVGKKSVLKYITACKSALNEPKIESPLSKEKYSLKAGETSSKEEIHVYKITKTLDIERKKEEIQDIKETFEKLHKQVNKFFLK